MSAMLVIFVLGGCAEDKNMFEKGSKLQLQQEYPQANEMYKELIKKHPKSKYLESARENIKNCESNIFIKGLIESADTWEANQQYQEEISAFKYIIDEINSQNTNVSSAEKDAYLNLSRDKIKNAENQIEISKLLVLADKQLKANKLQGAKTTYEKIGGLDPSNTKASEGLDIILAKQKELALKKKFSDAAEKARYSCGERWGTGTYFAPEVVRYAEIKDGDLIIYGSEFLDMTTMQTDDALTIMIQYAAIPEVADCNNIIFKKKGGSLSRSQEFITPMSAFLSNVQRGESGRGYYDFSTLRSQTDVYYDGIKQ